MARRQRFFVDVALPSGASMVAHCPNTGRLTGCLVPGSPVILQDRSAPGRKLSHTWMFVKPGPSWVGVDTGLAVPLVREAVAQGRVASLGGAWQVHAEVPYGKQLRSRIDLVLSTMDRAGAMAWARGDDSGEDPGVWIEVKSTTLMEVRDGQRVAMFPDAPSQRGRKHLEELIELRHRGARAVMVFAAQRCDVDCFAPAVHVDAAYASGLRIALREGVEVVALAADIEVVVGPQERAKQTEPGVPLTVTITLSRQIPVVE